MRPLMIVLTVLFAFAISGCASIRANSARQAYIHDATAKYIHKRSLETVFPEARKILFEYGYQVRDSNDNSLETEWGTSGSSEIRYLVTATKVTGGYKVQFTKNEVRGERSTQQSTARDLDMEWVLIERVDPGYAKKVSQEAEVRAQAAAK